SFDPNDIDTSRTIRDGPRVLKRFLEFARSGQIAQPQATGDLPDSPFETDVSDVIERLGYPCDHQVGSAGFRIDLGVRHPEQPGRYILAVECDGATYHSALWARERDRLRQDVLEGLGWRFHRIWSTDWFHRREAEIDRLKSALQAALVADGPAFSGANTGGPRAPVEGAASETSADAVLPPPPELKAPAYVAATAKVKLKVEPHEAPMNVLVDLVTKIVSEEGPIHRDLVARRVASAFGKARTGGRIQAVSDEALGRSVKKSSILLDGDFAMTNAQRNECPVRDRSAGGSPTKADLIPPTEIRAAAGRVLAESGEMPREDLIVSIARLLGFAKTGKELQAQIESVLSERLA
ncbi:MAG: DUF3320 domain-containing protein, partial [Planktotalea arctica]